MIIGAMSKRIVLKAPIIVDDEYGGQSAEYMVVKEVWAELVRTNYSEQQAMGAPMSRSQLQFKIRPRKDVKRGWSIDFDGTEYAVDVVDNTYPDRTVLIVTDLNAGV